MLIAAINTASKQSAVALLEIDHACDHVLDAPLSALTSIDHERASDTDQGHQAQATNLPPPASDPNPNPAQPASDPAPAPRILGEKTWESQANESVKVLPGLKKLLEDADKTWQDLTHVFVVKGPGAYTSLRVGITIANGLAWTLKIPMWSADVFELWENRLKEEKQKNPHEIVIAAGKDKYLKRGEVVPVSGAELKEEKEAEERGPEGGKVIFYGEIPEGLLKHLVSNAHGDGAIDFSFGEALIRMNLAARETSESIAPIYTRPPDITTPKGE